MPFDAAAMAEVVEAVIKSALAPLVARVKALEAHPPADLGDVRERIATLEAHKPEPGPAGPIGEKGADGVGVTDYSVDYDGERTFTHKWSSGGEIQQMQFRTPLAIFQGVYVDGKIYERGDLVTVNGSMYHANVDTTARPGNGSKDWTLAVKRGKDDRGGPWPR
jgi:hypothetical protein